jgi:1,4-alpha-glucan branching enzyme
LAALLLLSACVTREIVFEESGEVLPLGPRAVPGGVFFAVIVSEPAYALSVAGDFNGWRPAEHFLTNTPSKKLWSGFVPMTNQGRIEFKYIRNGFDWRIDPTTAAVSDRMGGKNSVFIFPAE